MFAQPTRLRRVRQGVVEARPLVAVERPAAPDAVEPRALRVRARGDLRDASPDEVCRRFVGHPQHDVGVAPTEVDEAVVDRQVPGTAVFTGDAVYPEENLDRSLSPGPAGTWSAPSLLRGYEVIRRYRDVEKATIFYARDGAKFKSYRQPPRFYD